MQTEFATKHDVVIAGAGIAAALTALCLLNFKFRPLILARRLPIVRGAEAIPASVLRWQDFIDIAGLLRKAGAVAARGFEVDFGGQENFGKPEPVFHVERIALARAALSLAVERGANLGYLEKPPVPHCTDDSVEVVSGNYAGKFQFAVDATGRSAFWSRPVARGGGNETAQLFTLPQNGAARGGKIVILNRGWAYRIDLHEEITVGVVEESGTKRNFLDKETLAKLDLTETTAKRISRRPAFPQWTLEPCRDNRIFSVGDAAFAHNPIAGQGVLFAINSAVALAAVLRTCRELPQNSALAFDYFRELVNSEKRRHLSFLKTFAGGEDISDFKEENIAPDDFSPTVKFKFSAPTKISGVRRDGLILPEETISLNTGGTARWLGEFDLLRLKDACSTSVSLLTLENYLSKNGLSPQKIERLIGWCIKNGILEKSNFPT